jgi:hypothetical protein
MLGIGSGINCVMLAVNWQKSLVGSDASEETDSVADVSAAVV